MADDLSLLFKLKAQNQASPVIRQVEGDVKNLAKSVGSDFNALSQVSTAALSKITSSITSMAAGLPVVGNAVSGISSELTTMATATETAGTELAAFAGPIGIAVIAIGAAAAGVAALSEELFSLAKSAASAQGKLFDLSQQTGVSVETLSALNELAKTTGGNIESIAQSLVVFQGNIEAAQDPTSKQSALFKQLGIDTDNTEEALRQALAAIAKMPEGFRQTNAAAELFGRRGGKQFLAILKESHGDIDKTIDELKSMGLASGDAAKRADEFNDQLVKLQTQLDGIVAVLGNELIPSFLKAGQIISSIVKENKDGIEALGVVIKALGSLISVTFIGAVQLLSDVWQEQAHQVLLLVELYERLAAVFQLVSNTVPNISANAIPVQPLGGGDTTDSLKELKKLLDAANNTLNTPPGKPFNLQEIFGDAKKAKASIDPAIQLLKQLQGELRNLQDATKAESIAAELLDTKYKNSSPTLKEQILLYARLIDQKNAEHDVDEKIREETEKRERAIHAEIDSLSNFIAAQTRAIQGQQSATNAAEEFILTFENVSGALDDATLRFIRMNAATIDSKKRIDELIRSLKDVAVLTPQIAPDGIPELGKNVFDDSTLGPPPDAEKHFRSLQAAIDDLGKSFGNLFGASKDFALQFGDVIGGAVADLAQGIGDLVEQYVLLGTTGPAALRKLLAATLAHLAAEAAVKAVFQLAEGFAALFINPAEAAAHFTSAAIFGSIAAGSAVAGRAVAGDLFKQPSRGGSNAQTQGSGALQTIITGRNQAPQPSEVHVVLHSNLGELDRVITASVVRNIGTGGEIREVIATDGRAR